MSSITGVIWCGLSIGGEAALADSNQEIREAWTGWHSNIVAVRSSIQQRSNNVARDASPHLTALQKRLAMDITLPAWPALTVAYTQGLSNSSFDSLGFSPTRNQSDSIETFLNYELFHMKLRGGSPTPRRKIYFVPERPACGFNTWSQVRIPLWTR